ncbi:MAG: chemotaxis-specific protein-glutamate methyltransferase CheB [Roseiflexus sp.]|nr:chemotaxis-specific protein-glutamate methyltransferase CheB [Roseiflexus sp.]MCS7289156.1 chemotaxis-specific protein-glutamate methyltransferase CheB [Roseiflexus sp.]MDW8145226.1 chemotaxis-specific protein-glutamate methyltransferase CheB [Roseiflexaceae bacterium]MDW8234239.1 chemotaxis-specific protein-glutamate methyltransferase CheB [Roseiflexaceae bacterium]
MTRPIRVVVVDDSALMRRFITDMLHRDPAIQVVGVAANGREAIEVVQRLRPDVVTMDVRMPVMDGLATTEHLMAYCPTPILVLTASLASYEVDITFKMLGAGALEVVEKPRGGDAQALERAARDLVRRVKILSRVRVVTHLRGRRRALNEGLSQQAASLPNRAVVQDKLLADPTAASSVPPVSSGPDALLSPIVVIGASTGGPRVIHQIISGLPRTFPAAVLVVQHIAEGFSAGMAEWLASAGTLPVRMAQEGSPIRAGEVLIAPDRRNLLVTHDGTVHLSDAPLLIQRPSIDVTMQAVADVWGSRAVGVLLTGMGRDGAYGMRSLHRRRAYTIAQDEASCAIFGMPRAAIQLGAVREVLPPAAIAPRLVEVVAELVKG